MKYILDSEYRNKGYVIDQKFFYDRGFSTEGHTVYKKFIPIWKEGDAITLEIRILLCLETGEVQIDVLDSSFKGRYAPYYLRESYYEDFVQQLDIKILNKLNEMHVNIIEGDN